MNHQTMSDDKGRITPIAFIKYSNHKKQRKEPQAQENIAETGFNRLK
jgi:hypothetical protein